MWLSFFRNYFKNWTPTLSPSHFHRLFLKDFVLMVRHSLFYILGCGVLRSIFYATKWPPCCTNTALSLTCPFLDNHSSYSVKGVDSFHEPRYNMNHIIWVIHKGPEFSVFFNETTLNTCRIIMSEPKLPLYTRINGPLLELSFYLFIAVYSKSEITVHLLIFIDFFGTNVEHKPKKCPMITEGYWIRSFIL